MSPEVKGNAIYFIDDALKGFIGLYISKLKIFNRSSDKYV